MNAQELFTKESKSAGVWYCAACKRVAPTEEEADGCCAPRLCACGAECTNGWTVCATCRDAAWRERVEQRLREAKKVPASEWSGPVVPEGTDGFSSLDDAVDHFECEGQPVPRPIWGTRPDAMRLDAVAIVEHATEEMYDGAIDEVSSEALQGLQEFLNAWASEHGPPAGWREDAGVVVVLGDSTAEVAEAPEKNP